MSHYKAPTIAILRQIAEIHKIDLGKARLKQDILDRLAEGGISEPNESHLQPPAPPKVVKHTQNTRIESVSGTIDYSTAPYHYVTKRGRAMTKIFINNIAKNPLNLTHCVVAMDRAMYRVLMAQIDAGQREADGMISFFGFSYLDDYTSKIQFQCQNINEHHYAKGHRFTKHTAPLRQRF